MKRIRGLSIAVLAVTAAAAFFTGCGNDGPVGPQGAQGPPGPPSPPKAIRILLAGAEADADLQTMVFRAYKNRLFPLGTEIEIFNLNKAVPTLDSLEYYNAVICWTDSKPIFPDSLGNVLARYVDAGGGVVLCQFAFSPQGGPITGRIMTHGYSPLKPGPAALESRDRHVDASTIAFPPHLIFYGVDIFNIAYTGQNSLSNPQLDPGATIIAYDDVGQIAVAVNPTNNVIALNIFGGWWFLDYREVAQLEANSALFVGGAF